jgi:predicted transcriptional regulator
MSIKTWSDDQEQELIRLYTEEDVKDVHELASHFSKGYRSVISKLVQLKVYEKPQVDEDNKTQTVKTMLRDLENMLSIEIDGTNLNKKENLVKLVEALKIRLGYETDILS